MNSITRIIAVIGFVFASGVSADDWTSETVKRLVDHFNPTMTNIYESGNKDAPTKRLIVGCTMGVVIVHHICSHDTSKPVAALPLMTASFAFMQCANQFQDNNLEMVKDASNLGNEGSAGVLSVDKVRARFCPAD